MVAETDASELAVFGRWAEGTMTLGTIALAASWFLIMTVLVLDFAGILREGPAGDGRGLACCS